MTTKVTFNPTRTAILAMDCQGFIVSFYVQNGQEQFLNRAASVLAAARRAEIPVIHVQMGFRPGLPEVNDRNKLLAALKSNPQYQEVLRGPAGAIHPALGPEKEDLVVSKHRVSAFAGTDLEMLLRARKIETLVLFGLITSGVVLATLVDAFDLDYEIVVISDCCGDKDPELHDALVHRLFPARGDVATAAEFIEACDNLNIKTEQVGEA